MSVSVLLKKPRDEYRLQRMLSFEKEEGMADWTLARQEQIFRELQKQKVSEPKKDASTSNKVAKLRAQLKLFDT